MTSDLLKKQLPRNLAFRRETPGHHVELGACLRILIIEAECGEIHER